MLADSGVASDVDRQAGLPHAGTRRQDDQVGALEPAEQRIEIDEAGADVADEVAIAGIDARRLEVLLQQLADVDEIAELIAAAQRQDQRFGASEHRIQVRPALVGEVGDLGGSADELPIGRIAPDDAGVVLDADRRGQLADEAREEGVAAGVLQLLAAVHFVRHRYLVDRFAALPEGKTGLVGPAVLIAVEVLGVKDTLDLIDRLAVHHERGEDRLFGLDVERG